MLGFEEVFEAAVAQAAPSDQQRPRPALPRRRQRRPQHAVPGDPDNYAAYLAARPSLARREGDLAPGVMAGTGSMLQMAAAVTAAGNGSGGSYGFDTLYRDGTAAGSDLAVLPAVDYTPSNLSHFTSSDYWFAGDLAATTTGWLGRWIDRNGSAANPLQAISIDQALSKAIRTAVNPVCAIPSTSNMGFSTGAGGYRMPPGSSAGPSVNPVMAGFAGVPFGDLNTYLGRARKTYGQAIGVADQRTVIDGQAATAPTYPAGSRLATKLQLAARLIAADLGTRVITIHWGWLRHPRRPARRPRPPTAGAQSGRSGPSRPTSPPAGSRNAS